MMVFFEYVFNKGHYMNGPVLSILGAVMFGVSSIVMRRAVIKIPDATLGVAISVPAGMLFFFVILLFRGQAGLLSSVGWQEYFYFSTAGIFHFAVYRSFMYNCVQLVGANVTSALRRVTTLVAVVLGVCLLGEPLTAGLVIGVLMIVFGITLSSMNPQKMSSNDFHFSSIHKKAFLWGIFGGVVGGTSPILIKLGLGSATATPLSGAFISHLAASLALGIPMISHRKRKNFINMPARALILFFIVGLLVGAANLFRYLALDLAPASVVSPLFSTAPVFLLGLSFLFNRKIEVFSRSVVIGIITVVIGSILLVS